MHLIPRLLRLEKSFQFIVTACQLNWARRLNRLLVCKTYQFEKQRNHERCSREIPSNYDCGIYPAT